jgi:tetratricopeptide (TPR) repeat protein
MLRSREGATPPGRDLLKIMDLELGNILAAWQWAVKETRAQDLMHSSRALSRYYEVRGRIPEGLEVLGAGIDALRESDPAQRRALGYLLVRRAWLEHWSGSHQSALAATRGVRLLRPLKEARGVVEGLRTLAIVAFQRGDYTATERYCRDALALTGHLRDSEWRAVVLDGLGLSLSALGRDAEALACHREALTINEQNGHSFQAVHNLVHLSGALRRCGDPRGALPIAEQALALARKTGFEQHLPYCLVEQGWVMVELGRSSRAQLPASKALALARATGDAYLLPNALNLLAHIATDVGRLDEASHMVRGSIRHRPLGLTGHDGGAHSLRCGETGCASRRFRPGGNVAARDSALPRHALLDSDERQEAVRRPSKPPRACLRAPGGICASGPWAGETSDRLNRRYQQFCSGNAEVTPYR